jgi:hypothetical protein
MKKDKPIFNIYIFKALLLICICYFQACKKDESSNLIPPHIELKTTGIYTSNDTTLAEGSLICIGIKAMSNGGENLCNLIVKSNNSQVLIDYGFNAPSLDKDIIVHKNADSLQKISIIIRNKNGGCDSLMLLLHKNGSAYKSVLSYTLTLGGQLNTNLHSFASFSNGLVYSLATASQNQALIDILYYYSAENLEYNCLSSPGGNVTGIFSGSNAPEFWNTKNTTYFSRSIINIPLSAFDNAQNDSIIIANIFTNGGRKAKALANNQIWGIQTASGKFGLLKVIAVNGLESGSITFSIKLQQ